MCGIDEIFQTLVTQHSVNDNLRSLKKKKCKLQDSRYLILVIHYYTCAWNIARFTKGAQLLFVANSE